MADPTHTGRIKARDDLTWTESDDGNVVILDLHTSRYLKVSATGSKLWALLADWTTPEVLTTSLVSSYGIDEETAERDAQAFVEGLRSHNLLLDQA
jgi:hypothetical protein